MIDEDYNTLLQLLLIKFQQREWQSVILIACELYAMEYGLPPKEKKTKTIKYRERVHSISGLRKILANPSIEEHEKIKMLEATMNKALETLMARETHLTLEEAQTKIDKWIRKVLSK